MSAHTHTPSSRLLSRLLLHSFYKDGFDIQPALLTFTLTFIIFWSPVFWLVGYHYAFQVRHGGAEKTCDEGYHYSLLHAPSHHTPH